MAAAYQFPPDLDDFKMKKLNKENIQDIFALTPLQEGMLLYYLKDPQSDYYFEQLSLEISGNIDFDIFEKSWNFVIETNEMLRAVFRWEKVDNPVQIILKEYQLQPRYCDFTGKTSNDLQNQLKEIKVKDREHKFDLQEVPFRVILSKISQNRYHMLISNHHILYDGWSTGIILKEFFQAYESLSIGSQPLVPIVKPGFKEFIQWHQEQDRIKQKKYWQNYLEGFDTPTRLPIKRSKTGAGYTGERNYRLHLNQANKDKLEVFVKERRITLAVVFYCAWGVLLQKYCGMEDVVFGINVSGRSAPIRGIENMAGLFINTVPLRVRSEPGENWRGFLVRINKHMAASEKYDNTPLVDIYSYCRQFTQAGEELFDSLVSVENYPLDSYLKESGPHLSIQSYSMEERPHYDLSLVISTTEGINIDFIYKNTSFDKETVVRLAHHFSNILKGIVENIENRPQEIEILSGKEKQQLLVDFNRTAADYPGEKTICRLFEEQAERTPDHVALTGPEGEAKKRRSEEAKREGESFGRIFNAFGVMQITYKELNEKSNGLAILLIEKGVQPDTIVGIMIERSLEMIIGILGILKAGGAYLPVDPGFPQERIDYMLKDSNARILLSEVSKESKVSEGTEIVSLSELSEEFPTHLTHLTHLTHPTQLCYIIYTSGSTGKPKGVLIQHGSVVNRLNWMQQMYPLGGDDIILQKTPFTFDVSVWELFWWSFYGARLCLLGPGEEKDPAAIIKSIAGYHITTIHFVPSMLNAFLAYLESSRESYRCIGLRRLFASGEALGASQVERFYSLLTVKGKCRVKLINLYGPTEAAIDVSYYNCCVGHRFDTVTVPIGKPIHNIRLFVVNINMGLQPIGIAGELCIAGVGLARGYSNRPELTAEKFDHDLWDYHGALAAGGKLYRTGDLARWLSGILNSLVESITRLK
jgi:tyrocidine synthetase-3